MAAFVNRSVEGFTAGVKHEEHIVMLRFRPRRTVGFQTTSPLAYIKYHKGFRMTSIGLVPERRVPVIIRRISFDLPCHTGQNGTAVGACVLAIMCRTGFDPQSTYREVVVWPVVRYNRTARTYGTAANHYKVLV